MHRFSALIIEFYGEFQSRFPARLEFQSMGVARNQRDCGVFDALRQMADLSVASEPGQDEAVPV
ncbi:hypothetical protein ACFQE0_07165 [Methylobacterium komagatae]|uniref:Uncharacterized protein n=1 Tax=Methylobacterium komagatae TaxID=374425 RepID=A0ABW2BG93_9HYPH